MPESAQYTEYGTVRTELFLSLATRTENDFIRGYYAFVRFHGKPSLYIGNAGFGKYLYSDALAFAPQTVGKRRSLPARGIYTSLLVGHEKPVKTRKYAIDRRAFEHGRKHAEIIGKIMFRSRIRVCDVTLTVARCRQLLAYARTAFYNNGLKAAERRGEIQPRRTAAYYRDFVFVHGFIITLSSG